MSDALEKKCLAALQGDLGAAELAALMTEVQSAISEADALASKECQRAQNPLATSAADARAARKAMDDAQFVADRLRTLLPLLVQQHQEVVRREALTSWQAQYAEIEAQRDAVAAELAQTYPQLVSQLLDLFQRVAVMDAEISRINISAPYGVSDRLARTELVARGLSDPIMQPDVVLMDHVRLPHFKRGDGAVLAWPPPQPLFIPTIPPEALAAWHMGPDTHLRREAEVRQRMAREDEAFERRLAEARAREQERIVNARLAAQEEQRAAWGE